MPEVMPDHVIVMTEESGAGATEDRVYWECSCGRSGSAASWTVDLAVDRHIPEGETRAYRTRAGGAWS